MQQFRANYIKKWKTINLVLTITCLVSFWITLFLYNQTILWYIIFKIIRFISLIYSFKYCEVRQNKLKGMVNKEKELSKKSKYNIKAKKSLRIEGINHEVTSFFLSFYQ